MKKRVYNKPMLVMEEFVPNQYVAACDLTHTILEAVPICAIPGSDAYYIADGIGGRLNPYGDPASRDYSRTHGSCGGTTGTAEIKGATGVEPNGQPFWGLQIGDEMAKGDRVTNNIGSLRSWTSLKPGCYYRAAWTSADNDNGVYYHYGALHVTGYSNRNFS